MLNIHVSHLIQRIGTTILAKIMWTDHSKRTNYCSYISPPPPPPPPTPPPTTSQAPLNQEPLELLGSEIYVGFMGAWEKNCEKIFSEKKVRIILNTPITLKFRPHEHLQINMSNNHISVRRNRFTDIHVVCNNYFMLTDQPEIILKMLFFLLFTTSEIKMMSEFVARICCHDNKSVAYILIYSSILSTCKNAPYIQEFEQYWPQLFSAPGQIG